MSARSKIVYIDELDEEDNVNARLEEVSASIWSGQKAIKPEVEWRADGSRPVLTMCPAPPGSRAAEAAALAIAQAAAVWIEREVIQHARFMQEAEGTRVEVRGKAALRHRR